MKGVEAGVATISEGAATSPQPQAMLVTGNSLNEDVGCASREELDAALDVESSIADASPASGILRSFNGCTNSISISVETQEVSVGAVFETLQQAREKCTEYAKCPLGQKSSKHLKFIRFVCFRGGKASMKQSSVSIEFQREKRTTKCQCPFVIKLRLNEASGFYEVYQMNNQHNHDLFTEVELALMPQNRFIPDEVKTKMLELNKLGILNNSQIRTLIEHEHFPDVPVTWTKRDVQNFLQKASNRARENNRFSCPVSMFNQHSKKDCEIVDLQFVFIDTALATRPSSEAGATQRLIEDQRLSELTALTKPILHRSVGAESTFQLYKASMIILGETIERNLQSSQQFVSDLEEDIVRNSLKARCKERPETANKRYINMADQLQNKKKQRGVTCSSCGQLGHNARTCKIDRL